MTLIKNTLTQNGLPMPSGKMTKRECQAIISLSTIMSLRMVGLFMVLPLFALYARQLEGATPALMGVAIGIYGLSQALFQIPFGTLSDHVGRKPVILVGLLIFALGSLMAGFSHSIFWVIVGRALQGVGAVGSTILAMIADLTSEEQRTKSMAISGITMGFSFAIAMLLGPLLSKWLSVSSLFYLAAGFALTAIAILYSSVPTPTKTSFQPSKEPKLTAFLNLLIAPELLKLNLGIFLLHAIFTASFVVIPISLLNATELTSDRQWVLYLPTLLCAFVVSLVCIGLAERKRQIKFYFLAAIITLMLSEFFLWQHFDHPFFVVLGLGLFFSAFSLLEAFLPSLISRTAPKERKGMALGIYSCAQFLGIFMGGVLGGWLYGKFTFSGVYLFCIILALFWFALAFFMQPPHLVTQVLRLLPANQPHWDSLVKKLQAIPGIIEVTYMAEEGLAYLKMERAVLQHPDFIHLKEQLQSESL